MKYLLVNGIVIADIGH